MEIKFVGTFVYGRLNLENDVVKAEKMIKSNVWQAISIAIRGLNNYGPSCSTEQTDTNISV